MYITYKRLCNVISESVAVEFFGKQFVEFKQRTDNDESAKDVADEILTKIGKGSTREVYKFKDNPNIVLKIINWNDNIGVDSKTGFAKKQMIDSNKWESDLQMQQKYPGIFPRTFEHADDFSWIVSEKVSQIKSWEELFVLMGLGEEKFSPLPYVRNIQFQALIELGVSYFQEPDGAAQQMLRENDVADFEVTKTKPIPRNLDDEDIAEPGLTAMGRRLKKLISNRQNAQLLAAMGDLDIPAVEFSPKNVGVSLITGKLILLDASLWKEYKPVTEAVEMNRHQLRSLIILEKKKSKGRRKHPRYRPPKKDPKTGKYDNPCGPGFAPGAQSGVKTKIGPQSGRRVSNCEKTGGKKNEQSVYDYQRDPYLFGKVDNPYDESELYKMQHMREGDPPTGTGKKPKGSSRRLYTDEDPSDTVSVEFKTAAAIKRTLAKKSFKSKSHNRQSQIINLIHQRARAAYRNAKDPKTKARLKRAYEYAKQRKEASKQKTVRLRNKK